MSPLPIVTPSVLFDISRLARSQDRPFATGVDRIDLSIGLDLLRRFGENCHFVCAGEGRVSFLPKALGTELLLNLDRIWNGDVPASPAPGRLHRIRMAMEHYLRGLFHQSDDKVVSAETTYVVASHSGVGKIKGAMHRLDPRRKMRRIVYIHDLIPLEYPEYQRPETFRIFSDYLAELTDAPLRIVANSQDTERRVRTYASAHHWPLEGTEVIIPSLELQVDARVVPVRDHVERFQLDPRPYFLVLGTIEPRKNHLLLLQIWRELNQLASCPRLCIVGKRGWENENVIDLLERCPALKPHVFEFSDISDLEVQALLAGALALLFPSFTEGLGIPILEAAALNVPCIASDIPVFREIAPPGTVFLSPLDGVGWKKEITARASGLGDGRFRS